MTPELLADQLDAVERRQMTPRPQHADAEMAETRRAVPAVVVGRDRVPRGYPAALSSCASRM